MNSEVFPIQICTVIYGKNRKEIETLANQAITFGANLVEIRLDLCPKIFTMDQIPPLPVPVILTNRSKKEGGQAEDKQNGMFPLDSLLQSSYDYIDLEITDVPKELLKRKSGEIIFSKHWFTSPNLQEMEHLVKQYGDSGVVKLIPTATAVEDNLTILKFVKETSERGYKIISFCMGTLGIVSRVLSPHVGGLWTYASLETPVADGQMQTAHLRRIYDDFLG